MNKMMEIAERIANLVALNNMYESNYTNKRECPFYSEVRGMEMLLKMMEIPFEYDIDINNDYKIIAVIVNGCRAEVN